MCWIRQRSVSSGRIRPAAETFFICKKGQIMRHIRNFFHNINDIVLAIIIVALAAGIIYWRMQVIMDYPKQLANERAEAAQEMEEQAEQEDEAADEAAPAEGSSDAQTDEAAGTQSEGTSGDSAEAPAEGQQTGDGQSQEQQ